MKYRRALLLLELEADAREPIAVLRRIAADLELLLIVAHVPEHQLAWVAGEGDQAALLERLCQAGADAAAHVEARLALRFDADTVADVARQSAIDLLAVGPPTRRALSVAADVRKRLTLRGYIISDHFDRFPEFAQEVGRWLAEGKIRYRETVVEGIERAPEAFIGLLRGQNTGKMVVRLG